MSEYSKVITICCVAVLTFAAGTASLILSRAGSHDAAVFSNLASVGLGALWTWRPGPAWTWSGTRFAGCSTGGRTPRA